MKRDFLGVYLFLAWRSIKISCRKYKQFLATICLGPITMGSFMNWTSPVLPQFLNKNSTAPFHFTTEESSWVGSMVAVGALSSALLSGYLADRFGSKKCLLAFSLPSLIFVMLVIFSNNIYMLCIARIFSGITIGGVSAVAPMYISEIADVSLRGTLSTFFDYLACVGGALTAIVGSYVNYVALTSTIGIITLVCAFTLLFLPESPTYLIKINKRKEAERALRFYRSIHYNVDLVLDEIKHSIARRSREKLTILEILKSKATRRGFIACVGLAIFQQLSGIDGITFYTVQIFQAAKTDLDAYTCGIIMATVPLITGVLVLLVIDKFDRKIFLYISSFGTCVCLALIGLYFNLMKKNVYFSGITLLPLISLFTYVIMFQLGLGPIAWMLNGELFVPEIKGIGSGMIITINWVLVFIISKTLPVMLKNWGEHYTFYLYSAFMVLCVVFIKYFVPETRGKTLEQIQKELNL